MFRFSAVFACLMLLVATASSQAAVVFSDNFDTYADQAAFVAAWPVVGSQPSGTLSAAQSVSAPNSVLIPSSSTTAVSARNGRSFTETGAPTVTDSVTWSFDFYDEAPTASPYRNYSTLQDGAATATGQLVSIGLNNNQTGANSGGQRYMARILGYDPASDVEGGQAEAGTLGSGAYFKFNDFGTAGQRSTGWHNMKVVISTSNGTSQDYRFYVDNVLAEQVLNIGTATRSYETLRLGAGVSSTNGAYYDNQIVEFGPVPEPSSLTLLGVAGLAMLRRRRA